MLFKVSWFKVVWDVSQLNQFLSSSWIKWGSTRFIRPCRTKRWDLPSSPKCSLTSGTEAANLEKTRQLCQRSLKEVIFKTITANHFQYSTKCFRDTFFLRKKSNPALTIVRFEHKPIGHDQIMIRYNHNPPITPWVLTLSTQKVVHWNQHEKVFQGGLVSFPPNPHYLYP